MRTGGLAVALALAFAYATQATAQQADLAGMLKGDRWVL
jgi:hypothetical protein